MMSNSEIIERLFEEFKEGNVYSKNSGYSIFYKWARFRGRDDIILVLRKYSNACYLDLYVGWLEKDGRYEDRPNYKFTSIAETWKEVGEWVFGRGERQRKTITFKIEEVDITSKFSDIALIVVNRARELADYTSKEKWNFKK